jgi:hypothetical protein
VHFDVTNPLGVGINGSNGFVPLGTVTSAQFPGLTTIPPGGFVDVYYNWTPNVALTPAQIQAGRFYFHSCVRVRIDHVAGETFFANQDGNGQQENIEYFDAGSAGSPGAPGAPNSGVVHLRNDSPVSSKQFFLSVLRDNLPATWGLSVNNGNPVVTLGPGQLRDVPVIIKQTTTEPVGSKHSIRVFASSEVTLRNATNPSDMHNAFIALGGVQLQVAVLRKPTLQCRSLGGGRVGGRLIGVAPNEKQLSVYVVGVGPDNHFIPRQATLAFLRGIGGVFTTQLPPGIPAPRRAICLFAGTTQDSSAGSVIFPM